MSRFNHRLVRRIAGLSLTTTLVFSTAAYASVVVPPIEVEDSAAELGSGPAVTNDGTGAVGPGVSKDAAGGPGVSDSASGGAASGGTADQIQKPVIQAEGAVLMDAATGKVLFGKNENTQFYPASITKIMTALLVLENCNLNDEVKFSKTATTNLESGAVTLSITEGDQLTVEQSLYGLMLKSANEIANGLAEHVSGSVSGFAGKMNQRAKDLGCLNTNFANPSGLNDTEHKTTAYDMALIARAAYQNEAFRKIDATLSYNFPATKKAAARTITMGHKMLYTTDARYYQGIIGGKTGYTSKAGNTLVTAVERDGVRLIAVILKSSSTHYTDTKALLDYGFNNYKALTGSTAPADSTGGSGSGGSVINPSGNAGGWKQDNTGWYYNKTDGARAKDEWLAVDGNDFWFDSNQYMAIGWRQFSNGSWYYFRSSGAMAKNYWVQTDGVWFYLGADGVMLTNATTPDGYRVNEVGIWVQ